MVIESESESARNGPSDADGSALAGSGSPRPTFDGAAHIRAQNAVLHLWGEPESGEVADWMYVSSSKVHHIMFGLAPGAAFGHSNRYRTVFAADELLYVLSGKLVISNPETGEVHVVDTGEAVFFRRDTWHHAISFGPAQLRVVEFFAPPPASGASSAYSRTRELLTEINRDDARWTGDWPMGRARRDKVQSFHVIRDADLLWAIDGPSNSALRGVHISTEHITAGKLVIRPGGMTAVRTHRGDAAMHVTSGSPNILLTDVEPGRQRWFELAVNDGFYVPEGVPYQARNVTDQPVELLFAVAPHFQ
jgi:mannose-6-phosphate isomerase-like protein (cupin superfamily)